MLAEWLKVGQSYSHHSAAPEQQSLPTEAAGLAKVAGALSLAVLGARRPRASDFFEGSKVSPLSNKESEKTASGDLDEAVTGHDDRHASGNTQRNKHRKSRDDEGTGKRKRQKQPSTFSSGHTSSSSDAGPRHRKKGAMDHSHAVYIRML